MLVVCRRCTTKYAVGMHHCPQCTSTDHYMEGEENDMSPKTTVHGGASDASVPSDGSDQLHSDDSSDVEEKETSPGSSSSTSTSKRQTKQDTEEAHQASSRKPAQTTESHSKKGQEESSSAHSTGGAGKGNKSPK